MRRLRAFLAGATSLLALGAGPATAVIAGDPAAAGDWPSAAYVLASRSDGSGWACSGSVVSPSVVLTAAHCIVDEATNTIAPPSAFTVITGRTDLAARGGQVLGVSRTAIPAAFTLATARGDVGLLQLSDPTAAPPIDLVRASGAGAYAAGTPIRIAGWGLLSPSSTTAPWLLHEADLVVHSDAYCAGALPSSGLRYEPTTMFCGSAPPSSAGACDGDSGGPVIARDPSGAWIEIGTTSWAAGDCAPPTVFARLAGLQPWLSEEIDQLQSTAPTPPMLPPSLTPPSSPEPRPLAPRQAPAGPPRHPAEATPAGATTDGGPAVDCAYVAPRPSTARPGTIALDPRQLLINQRISQAALRRANAVEARLDRGIRGRDLCGHAIARGLFGPSVTLGPGTASAALAASPEPIRAAPRRRRTATALSLTRSQLLTNQRISQAALRRLNALAARLEGGLTGGDVVDGSITPGKLARGVRIVAVSLAGGQAPASRTVIAPATGRPGTVTLSARQLRINQRISQAAVRRSNRLIAHLERGLDAGDFRPGSLSALDLAPELRP